MLNIFLYIVFSVLFEGFYVVLFKFLSKSNLHIFIQRWRTITVQIIIFAQTVDGKILLLHF